MGCANTSAVRDADAVIVVAIAAAIWQTIVVAMRSEQNEMRSEYVEVNRRRASCVVCYDGKNQPTDTHTLERTRARTKRMYTKKQPGFIVCGRFSLRTRTPSILVTNYARANDVAST